ncbi:MAG: undecaprenyldiphospho-muramoylpentapeptide beta-N-acetylglucosaminyltransferase [Acutalibacteraceae bacterium]|nr:undecaprenyldiphospho-muramoylpentapeptide beta-N-acetylglucosaminyltransferase [Acutalibacteraceae bacterium]
MKIVFVAGGTGGHINPALAVAGALKEKYPDTKISFIGNRTGMEATLVPKAGYDFFPIDVAGFQRKISLNNIKRNAVAVYRMFKSSVQSEKLLEILKPDIVVGTGGYTCGPVLRKAAKMGIKTATHEQNAFPGVTTKTLCKYVDEVMVAMPDAIKRLPDDRNYIVTGNPVRQSIINTTKEEARKKLGLDMYKPMILSLGGSLGARAVNEAIADVLAWHANSKKYYHFHAIGKYGVSWMPDLIREKGVDFEKLDNLRITEYIYDMDLCMAAADLVINRAGASTISELQVKGMPSILIPSPNVAENHQYYNAKTLADNNAAILIEEKDLTGESLINAIKSIIDDKEKLKQMGENAKKTAVFDANDRICDVIMNLYNSKQ